MNLFESTQQFVREQVQAINPAWPLERIAVETPKDASHGEMATNAAMVLAKEAGMNPRQLAEQIAEKLRAHPMMAEVTLAGPGFINMKFKPEFWHTLVPEILASGTHFGDSKIGGGAKVNIEFVSANPTGPMHAGHVRGAVIGDALVRLLRKAGYEAVGEYYFNDAGAQVDVLARTAHLRYREALGEDIGPMPEGMYPGDYLKEVAAALVQRDGKKWLDKPEEEWLAPLRSFAIDAIMQMIRDDLALIGIRHDVFTNEREMIENGTLDKVFKVLEDKGLIYTGTLPPPKGKEMEDWEPAPLTLFRSSQFGDSSDRPLKKRDGFWAYIMPDFAYHYDKMQRGFNIMINVLGTDHAGYLERVRPAVMALSDNKAHLDVIFNNMVKVFKNGEPVKLSKRSGNIITLREMVEQVGAGAVRFFMLSRDPKSPLDFDFTKVVEQTKDNPVFYVQYAHARTCSVLRQARENFPDEKLDDASLLKADLSLLTSDSEIAMIRKLAEWPNMVGNAARSHEPHKIAFYLQEVAAELHSLWTAGKDDTSLRFIVADDAKKTAARLALLRTAALVIAAGLAIIGVEPAEQM